MRIDLSIRNSALEICLLGSVSFSVIKGETSLTKMISIENVAFLQMDFSVSGDRLWRQLGNIYLNIYTSRTQKLPRILVLNLLKPEKCPFAILACFNHHISDHKVVKDRLPSCWQICICCCFSLFYYVWTLGLSYLNYIHRLINKYRLIGVPSLSTVVTLVLSLLGDKTHYSFSGRCTFSASHNVFSKYIKNNCGQMQLSHTPGSEKSVRFCVIYFKL